MSYIISERLEQQFGAFINMIERRTCNGTPSLLLHGPPGGGKTAAVRYLEGRLNAKAIFRQCTVDTQSDDLMYQMAPTKPGSSVPFITMPGLLVEGARLSQKKRTIVFIDELDKASPEMDAFLLNFMQTGEVSTTVFGLVKSNLDNLIVIIAVNDNRQLDAALYRRFSQKIRLEFPDKKELVAQLKAMTPLATTYNKTKFHYFVNLILELRKHKTKYQPAQSQMQDMLAQFEYYEGISNYQDRAIAKWEALMSSYSADKKDHDVINQVIQKIERDICVRSTTKDKGACNFMSLRQIQIRVGSQL